MIVGLLEVELVLPSNSLKEKRKVLRSIKDKIHHRFNVSIAEIDGHDLWQRATFAFAVVGRDGGRIARQLHEILKTLDQDGRFEVTTHRMEFR